MILVLIFGDLSNFVHTSSQMCKNTKIEVCSIHVSLRANDTTLLISGINSFNHLFELAVRLRIGATGWNNKKDDYKEAIRYFQKKFEDATNLRIGYPNAQGGTSTTGNVVSKSEY